MKAPVKSSNYEPAPEGTHVARLYQIVHIGTIPTTYMGEEKMSDKVRLTFELCNELKEFKEGEGEKPISVSTEQTFSMHPKASLRKYVNGIIGAKLLDSEAEAFDLEDLLGKPCLVTVQHTESLHGTFAKIVSTAPLVKGMEAPAQVNENKVVDVLDLSEEEFSKLPDFLQEKIAKSQEWQSRKKHTDADFDEDAFGDTDQPDPDGDIVADANPF